MATRETHRVTCGMRLENLKELWEAERGVRSPGDVRKVTIEDAFVDTGVATLLLPSRYIKQLGLERVRGRSRSVSVFEPLRMTIQDRDCTVDVREIGDDVAVVIGLVPMGLLDFVVDPIGQRIIGNPAHDGEWASEVY
jgi:hypothetical protein